MYMCTSASQGSETSTVLSGYRRGRNSPIVGSSGGYMAGQRIVGPRQAGNLYLRIVKEAQKPSVVLASQLDQSTGDPCPLHKLNIAKANILQLATVPQKRSRSVSSPPALTQHHTEIDSNQILSFAKRGRIQSPLNMPDHTMKSLYNVFDFNAAMMNVQSALGLNKALGGGDAASTVETIEDDAFLEDGDTASQAETVEDNASFDLTLMPSNKQVLRPEAVDQSCTWPARTPEKLPTFRTPTDCVSPSSEEPSDDEDPFVERGSRVALYARMSDQSIGNKMPNLSRNMFPKLCVETGSQTGEMSMNVEKKDGLVYKRKVRPVKGPAKTRTYGEVVEAEVRKQARGLLRHEMFQEDRGLYNRPRINRNQGIPFALPVV
ncbi:hypothetical protein BD289DRAFT_456499 [Coniella lustricola]|uniref:Uncharacterized protein n=1 Tax=Coniella lustricola TaxID=2025994 RepID=A0A2T2ZVL5_9PEZI|nr:hypothetical protein BD289DRAFT_456499 [Coniella lustricola]